MRDKLRSQLLKHAEEFQFVQNAAALYGFSWGFAILNFFLSLGFFVIDNDRVHFLITTPPLTTKVWAVIFFALGVMLVYALVVKRNRLLHTTMWVGLFLKSSWLISLIIRLFVVGLNSLPLIAVWAVLIYFQLITLVYLPDEQDHDLQ